MPATWLSPNHPALAGSNHRPHSATATDIWRPHHAVRRRTSSPNPTEHLLTEMAGVSPVALISRPLAGEADASVPGSVVSRRSGRAGGHMLRVGCVRGHVSESGHPTAARRIHPQGRPGCGPGAGPPDRRIQPAVSAAAARAESDAGSQGQCRAVPAEPGGSLTWETRHIRYDGPQQSAHAPDSTEAIMRTRPSVSPSML